MVPLYVEITGFVFALIFATLFAFLETAFTALRLFKLKELKTRVAKYHTLFSSWEKSPQRILITILIANNFHTSDPDILFAVFGEHHDRFKTWFSLPQVAVVRDTNSVTGDIIYEVI